MFLQLKKINNESGIVLFIVLMTTIIIMILSVGILTQSMNEINYAQQQIDQITCDELKKGVFWEAESTGVFPPAPPAGATIISPASYSITSNGSRTYTIVTSGVGTAISPWQVTCSYDTFN